MNQRGISIRVDFIGELDLQVMWNDPTDVPLCNLVEFTLTKFKSKRCTFSALFRSRKLCGPQFYISLLSLKKSVLYQGERFSFLPK